MKATKPTIPSPIPLFKTTVGIVSLVFGCLMVLVAIASVVFWKNRAKKRLVEIPNFSKFINTRNFLYLNCFSVIFYANVLACVFVRYLL